MSTARDRTGFHRSTNQFWPDFTTRDPYDGISRGKKSARVCSSGELSEGRTEMPNGEGGGVNPADAGDSEKKKKKKNVILAERISLRHPLLPLARISTRARAQYRDHPVQ